MTGLRVAVIVLGCLGTAACQRTEETDAAEAADAEPAPAHRAAQPADTPVASPADTPVASPEAPASESPAETGEDRDAAVPPSGAAPGDPSWMRVDESARTVSLDIVAGLDATNSSWNFNGHANGDLTITVPQGWTVAITLTNQDGDLPHSVYFLDDEPPFPRIMPERPDIPRAYSVNLQNGIGAGQEDTFRFPVNEPGRYTMPCGVPGHAAGGMWDWFVVSTEAQRPSVEAAS